VPVEITTTGSFTDTSKFLNRMSKGDIYKALDGYARQGVEALSSATPQATGRTAASWSYEIQNSGRSFTIYWTNNDIDEQGAPIAILLQYGHGTGTGGYVQGKDYINPAIQPIMDQIAADVWKEVSS
jgi:hypothetical protein